MSLITHAQPTSIQEMPGVTLFHFTEGEVEKTLVRAEPGVVIPLHTHEVDAEMLIVRGTATVLSDDETLNGTPVRTGSRVFFKKKISHGFEAGPEGLEFVSLNDGIRRPDGSYDVQMS